MGSVSAVYLGFIQVIDTLDAPKIHLRYTPGYTLDTPHTHLRYTPDTPGPGGQLCGQWPPALCSIWVYRRFILDTFEVYLGCICSASGVYLQCIWGESAVYLGCICSVSGVYPVILGCASVSRPLTTSD